MTDRRLTSVTLEHLLKLAAIVSVIPVITQAKASEDWLPSSCPALDAATKAFAEGRFDTAGRAFEALSRDASVPPYARGLALFGLAEVALSKKNFAQAIETWKRLTADEKLLRFHRETASRRIEQTKRLEKGLPARDPNSYRIRLTPLPEPAKVFYVLPIGSDSGDGSKMQPFHTLERARDAIRSLKRSRSEKLPTGGVRVMIAGGEYPWLKTLELTPEDSGTAATPIVYQVAANETAIFCGGAKINQWRPISDTKMRAKLDVEVRDRVLEANLKALGIENLGDATSLRRCPELFVNGKPQTLARWPDKGFTKTGAIHGKDTFKVWNRIQGCRDGKFAYVEDRPSEWTDEPDVRLYGYWFWDWFEEFQKVESIDPETRTFTLARPYSRYGYRKDQRYYALNIFRELDAEGEWYLDRRTSKIYWLAPDGIDLSKAEVVLSVFDQPFITMTDVEHVFFCGLTLQAGRGNGIHVRGGADCLLSDCTIRRFGGDAIVVEGGQRHGILGCMMNTLGCGGTRVAGGDRRTLTPGGHFVENCSVSDISRLKRTYAPAVHLDGCGNRVAHNLFENIPSSAMRIEGNDHLIELNVVRNVVKESDDQGGLDMYGNPLYRGVVIRWNHWIDIGGGTQHGAAGVRLDDMISGVAVYGNIFERCGAVNFGGVQIHGGKENLIEGNLFVDCIAGLSFSRWSEKRWLESAERFLPQAGKPPYSSRYPALANLKSNANVNLVCRNIFAGCDNTFLRDGRIQETSLNVVADKTPEIADMTSGRTVDSDSALFRSVLFESIPVDEIGPSDYK
jgi:hypothetical protein